MKDIVIKNAKENNLKGINLTIPREKLVVFTGLSGSGKSSLAFDTIFAEGGEQLARKFKLPVWFIGTRRRRRGEYETFMIELYDGDSPIEEHVITERYIRTLEKYIIECPELWLWSHRRWKAKKEK